MKTRSFILLALVVLVNLQLYAQTFVTHNGKLTTIAAEAVSANGAIGAATVVGRDGKVFIPPPPPNSVFIAPGVYIEFMPHNLGANTALDPHTPVQGIHGNYYQWGRSTVVADATTSSGAIGGWNTASAANGAWADGSKTGTDPCPAGYRVPTNAQWAGVIANNTVSRTSNNSWAAGDANFGSAIHWGPDVSTKNLTLPAAGFRHYSNGTLFDRGNFGTYWSSTENGSSANRLNFNSSTANTIHFFNRTSGFSVRCVSLIPATSTVFIAPGVSKAFMSHNLGANTALDPHTPVQGIHGNYYQWGSSTVVANATTPAGPIGSWNTTPAANGAWADGSKTANDPCPAGYRVPTNAQWAGVIANNTVSRTSNNSWAAGDANFGSAIHWGPDVSTKNLTLPAAGYLRNSNGALNFRGGNGFYWSSTEFGANASFLYFISSNAITSSNIRTYGFSVRCVSE